MNKQLKKAIALLSIAALSAGCFAGCGTKQADDGKVVISLGDTFPDEQVNPEAYKTLMDTVKAFEEKYPNVKIEDPKFNFNVQTYMSMAEAGTLPTSYYLPLTESAKVMEMGYAADLTDEFKARGFYDNVSDFAMDLISKNGRIYYVPDGYYDQGIIVNLDLYEKAGLIDADGNLYQPETWEDLAQTAKKIKEVTGADGFALPTSNNQGGWRFTTIAWSYGTVFEEQKDGKWTAAFASPECEKALQYVKDLKWKYDVVPSDALLTLGKIEEQFAAGNIGMMVGEPNRVYSLTSTYKMDINKIGMIRIPSGDHGTVSMMGGSLRVIDRNATPEQIKAVLDWLEFNGTTVTLTDEIKTQLDSSMEVAIQNGNLIGPKTLSPWKDSSEVVAYKNKITEENTNVDPKHIEKYNNKDGVRYNAEEPVDAQALYAILDTAIQEVIINKDADPAALLKKAAEDFQKNNLDYAN